MGLFKKITCLSLLFVILFINISYADDWADWKFEDSAGINYRYTDNYQLLFKTYETLTQNFLIRLMKAKQTGSTVPDSIIDKLNRGYWIYIYKGEENTYGEKMYNVLDTRPRYLSFVLYRNMTSYSSREPQDNSGHDAYNGHSIITPFVDMSSSYAFSGQCDYNNITLSADSGSSAIRFVIPQYLIQYNSELLTKFLIDYNNQSTTDEILNTLRSIDTGIDTMQELQTDTNQKLDDTNKKLDDANDELQEQTNVAKDTNSFLKNQNVDDSSTNLEIDNTLGNPYTNQIDSIFTKVYDKFTSFNGLDFNAISFTIPFADKQITITNQNIEAFKNKCGILVTFINLFWFYVVSRMIVLDILKIIENLSSGDFLDNKTDTTIKADML